MQLDNILAFDSQCFLLNSSSLRRPFLAEWIQVPGGAAFVAVDHCGQVVGLGCRRPAIQPDTHLIGPLYASNDDIAHGLLVKLSQDVIGQNLILSVRSVECRLYLY